LSLKEVIKLVGKLLNIKLKEKYIRTEKLKEVDVNQSGA